MATFNITRVCISFCLVQTTLHASIHQSLIDIVYLYFSEKRSGTGSGSVANNSCSAIGNCRSKILVGKKTLDITKMTNHFSHTKEDQF